MTEEVLTSYLLQHKSISIPGLGTIYVERIPAQTDFVNKQILPPSYHYRFDKYFDAPDKEFFTYLAQQKDIADYEAIKWYNEWAYQLRNRLRVDQQEDWAGIGTLKIDHSGDIVFEAAGAVASSLQPAPANRVVHQHAQATMLVGDKEVTRELHPAGETVYPWEESERVRDAWWIYALIIAAVAGSAIFFHFYKNGFNAASLGNQQTIEKANH
ncbi:MAG: hypothetical protein P0Y53_22020 [Candidatus Pseudobacter hemicellulosilyticus]|uniref:CCDC81-like prokaryotic HU domain-containing protein n=1 Tax=Candidatus Pseudobacter hemicellulosilyticus TaxID=3121375 RepID=A0AAJ5WQQ4_9BACT|nr:MAG: hypothetical protein P0Y53_22020 [Pseudobacter sp.]